MRTALKRICIKEKDLFPDIIKARAEESLTQKKDVHACSYQTKLPEFNQDAGHGQVQATVQALAGGGHCCEDIARNTQKKTEGEAVASLA